VTSRKPKAYLLSLTGTFCSYRLNIWTREAPEEPSEPSALQERITKIGRHFKQEVLGVPLEVKLTGTGGFSTDVEFASHKESTKKSKDNSKKIIL
jgi:translation initiation factor 4E